MNIFIYIFGIHKLTKLHEDCKLQAWKTKYLKVSSRIKNDVLSTRDTV